MISGVLNSYNFLVLALVATLWLYILKAKKHMGSVKGRMANNNPTIGIMGIADMFLIGFLFSHGHSPFLRLWKRTAALFCCRPLIPRQQGRTGLSKVGKAHLLAFDWLGWVYCSFYKSIFSIPRIPMWVNKIPIQIV